MYYSLEVTCTTLLEIDFETMELKTYKNEKHISVFPTVDFSL